MYIWIYMWMYKYVYIKTTYNNTQNNIISVDIQTCTTNEKYGFASLLVLYRLDWIFVLCMPFSPIQIFFNAILLLKQAGRQPVQYNLVKLSFVVYSTSHPTNETASQSVNSLVYVWILFSQFSSVYIEYTVWKFLLFIVIFCLYAGAVVEFCEFLQWSFWILYRRNKHTHINSEIKYIFAKATKFLASSLAVDCI